MISVAIVPFVVCVAGLLLWTMSTNPKVSEAGKIAFAVGLLSLCFVLAQHTIRIG